MNVLPLNWVIDVNAVQGSTSFSYEATAEELDALKRYLDVEDVTAYSAEVRVSPLAHGRYRAAGHFVSSVVQTSVISLEMVRSQIGEDFLAEYWPAEAIESANGETLPLEEEQPEAIVDGRLPIGSLLCELLALAIDPYPHNEGDVIQWTAQAAEIKSNPFAKLDQLKPKKGNGVE
jgi:hypothetical protein